MSKHNVETKTLEQNKDYWATPVDVYKGALGVFKAMGEIPDNARYAVDVCASVHNAKHATYITEEQNALRLDWRDYAPKSNKDIVWCNPPYSRGSKAQFIDKAIEMAKRGVSTIMLLPSDTSTQWFTKCVEYALAAVFVTDGRINFIDNATGKPRSGNNTGSVLFLFGKNKDEPIRTKYIRLTGLIHIGEVYARSN